MARLLFSFISLYFLLAVTLIAVNGQHAAAEVDSPERMRLLERDNGIPKEKVERAEQEALRMMEDVKKAVSERYPKLKFGSETFSDPASAGVGRKGQAGFYLSWRRRDAQYSIYVVFLFDPEEAKQWFRINTNSISMGEFYPAPEFAGETSVLVKNVHFNKSVTDVGFHFVKGRLKISTILRNHKRTAAENERDLIEFVKSVEPIINAKPTFEDL